MEIFRYIVKSDRCAVTESLKNQPAWQKTLKDCKASMDLLLYNPYNPGSILIGSRIGRGRQGWYKLVIIILQSVQKAQGRATLVAVMQQCNYRTRGSEPTRRDSKIKSFCGHDEFVAAASSPEEAQSW